MPRPGPRRRNVPLRLSEAEEEPIRRYADQEADGNLSEMIRTLLTEAVTARQNTHELQHHN